MSGGGGGGLRHFFSAAPSALTIFKRQIRGTRRSDSDILTSKKKKKATNFVKIRIFLTKNRPTTKKWGGHLILCPPPAKSWGGQDPPVPPGFPPMYSPNMVNGGVPLKWVTFFQKKSLNIPDSILTSLRRRKLVISGQTRHTSYRRLVYDVYMTSLYDPNFLTLHTSYNRLLYDVQMTSLYDQRYPARHTSYNG